MRLSSLFLLCSVFLCGFAKADVKHQLFRKMAVFPIGDANFATSEDAWWQLRETLTKDQRFLVASRRFMINRGVFQPRKTLKPADAIILGKILDAEALATTYLDGKTLRLLVYSAENGSTLFDSSLALHPALPAADQLIRASKKLAQDFLLALPYQGYQIVDEVVGKAVFEVDGQKHAWVFQGANTNLKEGDPVQWVDVRGESGEVFFGASLRTQIIGEGRVVMVRGNQAEVEVEKIRDLADLKENALVRFPKDMERLKSLYGSEEKGAALTSEYLSSEMKKPAELEAGHHPTSTALAFIGNIALLVLLAF